MSERYNSLAPAYATYYESYYPYEEIVKWLTYNGSVPTQKREWSYEIITATDETFVTRFREIAAAEQLRSVLCFSPKTLEDFKLKLDIGPIYTSDMSQRKTQPDFAPCERELVFDIDAGDYDRIRTCCAGADMCDKCWRFMELAVPLLILFCRVHGFSNYFFAFSGRRGLHCWICDARARKLSKEARKSIVDAFNIVSVDTGSVLRVSYNHSNWLSRLIHDHICARFFPRMLEEQDWLEGSIDEYLTNYSKDSLVAELRRIDSPLLSSAPIFFFLHTTLCIYSCLSAGGLPLTINSAKNPDGRFTSLLSTFIGKLTLLVSSVARWTDFELLMKDYEPVLAAIRVYYTYPRFDVEVTRGMNHLLKIPFSVHSKSRKISIPFPAVPVIRDYSIDTGVLQLGPLDAEDSLPRFLPSEAPTIDDLLNGHAEHYLKYRTYFSRIVQHITAQSNLFS